METTPSFSYRSVDSGSRGFRLAILQPSAHFTAPITCNLVEVTLNDHPIYEALSYAWGDPKIQATLQIEGACLKVTTNLELALRYLRLPDQPRTIWADAICIDQSNIEERNQQVGLMKDIYSSCTVDLVWIGESDWSTQRAIDTIKRMKSLNFQRLTNRGVKDFGIMGSDKLVSFSELGIDDIGASGLLLLLKYPTLWERVWVMQEIACCPRAVLVVGNLTLPWETLSSILDHSGTPDQYHRPFGHQTYDKDIWDAFSNVQVIEHQREALNLTVPINSTLLDVLSRFRATYCTDPRDKIYGLLGLVTDNLGIIPDYKKTTQEVYIDVARAQINSTQNLDIITQSLWPLGQRSSIAPRALWRYSYNPSSMVENLPSWLPNFSSTKSKKILFAQRSIFSAGAEKCKCPIDIDSDGALTVTGIVLGAIKTMKPIQKMVYSSGQYFSQCARDWMPDGLADPNCEDKSYITGENAFEAYWRTLMTDCLAHPSRRLSQDDLKECTEIFNEWRQKAFLLPLSDMDLGKFDKYDGAQGLLYQMDGIASRTGISSLTGEWQFAELDGGMYVMVPCEGGLTLYKKLSKIGDLVVAVDGGKVPLVLRERNNVGHHESGGVKWEVIGTAYAHGFMDGLSSQWAGDGKLRRGDFDLI